jgi:thiamine pyrophosphokinase
LNEINDSDIIIAANGGTQNLLALGLLPHVIIGDLDSLHPELLSELSMKGVKVLRYPSQKDETDLELALLYAKQLGIHVIIIYFALGARWDMTVANLLLPSHIEFQDVDIRIIDGNQEITLLRGEATQYISGRVGDIFSILPIGGKAEGITSDGLQYRLENDSLDSGSPRGVSNVLIEDNAYIHLKTGLLLSIHIKQNKALD